MASLLSRYKGCLVGGVIGDCVGQVFEGLWNGPVSIENVLKDVVMKIEIEGKSAKKPKKVWEYTDDTAMARSVVKSLIANDGLNPKDMAQSYVYRKYRAPDKREFTDEFHKESGRGYGGSVVSVFWQLKENKCEDIFGPASKQFDGQGSYGNGGAMRISPAALFAHHRKLSFDQLKDMVTDITRITHTHDGALHGAILQCYAVYLALTASKLNVNEYLDELKDKMKELEDTKENNANGSSNVGSNGDKMVPTETAETTGSDSVEGETAAKNAEPSKNQETTKYCDKLEKIRELVSQEDEPAPEIIDEVLGTDIAAIDSVPAAIYSFLRAIKSIKGIENRNPFERTVIYAISHGGDTDTIATMAGSIAGAYYGIEEIPSSWVLCCEGTSDALNDAEKLHSLK